MKLKVFSIIFICNISIVAAQFSISGTITNELNEPIPMAEVYVKETFQSTVTNNLGEYTLEDIPNSKVTLIVYNFSYKISEVLIDLSKTENQNIQLLPLSETLNEVILKKEREKVFALRKLKQVEGTVVFAGKKNEVILIDNLIANVATNSPRQIYSQIAGLNIYENDDAGLQLNIGGRGLDPNRSSNFNTRQNYYDISADVLGYPESYYTPPAESIEEIQILRGAASLQFGTQFGGLINFNLKRPNPSKKIEILSRNTVGSYGLYTNFSSLSGTVGKFSYYTFFNYKQGNGWRDNSQFNSRNYYVNLGYEISNKTKITTEITLFNYLAQQPGGLNDNQFNEDPSFTNRERNWFDVDWLLYSIKLDQDISSNLSGSLQFFGLDAKRNALGFRVNRVSQPDNNGPRELLVDEFKNWGLEGRLIYNYKVANKTSYLLVGSKYYNANNGQRQGVGSDGRDPDFTFKDELFPSFEGRRVSQFDFDNENVAVFAENVFNLNNKWAITPGFRWEKISTGADGFRENLVTDLAGNIILDEDIPEQRMFDRNFILFGTGLTFKPKRALEFYTNFSQNYRSVTFNDIRIIVPNFFVDENISDERGYTFDIGARGNINRKITYDLSLFALRYKDRIGETNFSTTDGRVNRFRSNIGDAFIYGLESVIDWNIGRTLFENNEDLRLNTFLNFSFIDSEYLTDNTLEFPLDNVDSSSLVSVEGNKVEFIPDITLKTGINIGYKNFETSILYSYVGEQFTDARNSIQITNDASTSGIIGTIPSYGVMDISSSFTYKFLRFECGINNVLDSSYFTRRATGYPGPGIIPSQPLTWYTGLQIKI